MQLSNLDWIIIGFYFVAVVLIGFAVAKISGKNAWNFFLGGREMPWWLLGVSMVATTFSTDTPNLVTDIVRQNGVAGNWVWWAFLITGMITVFLYAKLWRRTDVITDIAFYEVRYTGKSAAFLRGFRALYLGVFFNIMIMASVTLAAIKIGGAYGRSMVTGLSKRKWCSPRMRVSKVSRWISAGTVLLIWIVMTLPLTKWAPWRLIRV